MKKTVFGYDIKEVDEEMEMLVKKNSRLLSEVDELKSKLYSNQNEKTDEEWEEIVHSLEVKLAEAENKAMLLQSELDASNAKIQELEEEIELAAIREAARAEEAAWAEAAELKESENEEEPAEEVCEEAECEEVECEEAECGFTEDDVPVNREEPVAYEAADIGELYQEAYVDVMKIRSIEKDRMLDVIDEFVNNWEVAYRQMETMVSENTAMMKKANESFNEAYEDILSRFDEMYVLSNRLGSDMEKTKAGKDKLYEMLLQSVNEVLKKEDKQL